MELSVSSSPLCSWIFGLVSLDRQILKQVVDTGTDFVFRTRLLGTIGNMVKWYNGSSVLGVDEG